ncbi:hypothetical protein EYZ11_006248 [Aspergillus tanneri]|nr:hypothetical protein EYZ11_006248 [Aspergillus tanneri]
MAAEGRMPSFNKFMVGKFMKTSTMPERVKKLGYDLQHILSDPEVSTSVAMVDIGGGSGELLLEVKETFPYLKASELVVQEFNDAIVDVPGITLATWDFKGNSPQPIKGALIYNLGHVVHNLPDLEAVNLLQKISEAMANYSRLLIHEFSKNVNNGKLHTTMVVLFGGRHRTPSEWHQLAALAGLRVTFEAYPSFGAGLIEMRKL